jgi:hypothetical protein
VVVTRNTVGGWSGNVVGELVEFGGGREVRLLNQARHESESGPFDAGRRTRIACG